jgi:hypothetical protein
LKESEKFEKAGTVWNHEGGFIQVLILFPKEDQDSVLV